MASFDYARLRHEADRALVLSQYSTRKMVMIHSGVTIGLGLLVSLLGYFLDLGIAQTGGLGGIGTRTILETIQSVLEIGHALLLPFWAIGYVYVVLQWNGNGQPGPRDLLQGFRRFGPVLRLQFLRGLLFAGLGMAGGYLGSAIFLLTPGAAEFFGLMQSIDQTQLVDTDLLMQSEEYMLMTKAMSPYMIACAALFVAPMAYRLRFADYVLMDEERGGALFALLKSWHMTRRNCGKLLKLDLRFWWYHLAGLVISVIGYGDLLLSMMGIDLGIDAVGAMFGFYSMAMVLEFCLHTWRKNQVQMVYALAYRQLEQPATAEEAPKPQPKKVPWD